MDQEAPLLPANNEMVKIAEQERASRVVGTVLDSCGEVRDEKAFSFVHNGLCRRDFSNCDIEIAN
jgi:hypothetical protein